MVVAIPCTCFCGHLANDDADHVDHFITLHPRKPTFSIEIYICADDRPAQSRKTRTLQVMERQARLYVRGRDLSP